jgi:predicted type IV restriction endonuclease
MNSIIVCIEKFRIKLDRHRKDDLKEYPTRTISIDPLLYSFGWDVRDPDGVELEQRGANHASDNTRITSSYS